LGGRATVRTDLAPCGGVRRARSILLVAGPTVGRRDRKILAEILELWPVVLHRIGIDPLALTEFPVRGRADFARLDFAAAAPEDVGVAHRDADGFQVLVDGVLVREDEVFVR